MTDPLPLGVDWSWPKRPDLRSRSSGANAAPVVTETVPPASTTSPQARAVVQAHTLAGALQRVVDTFIHRDAPDTSPAHGYRPEVVSAIQRCQERLQGHMARLEKLEREINHSQPTNFVVSVTPVRDFDHLMSLHRALALSLNAERAQVATYRDGEATYDLVLTRPTLDIDTLTRLREAIGGQLTLTIRSADAGPEEDSFVIRPASNGSA